MAESAPKPSEFWPQQSPITLVKADSYFVELPDDFVKIEYDGGPFEGTFEGSDGHKNFVFKTPTGKEPRPMISVGCIRGRLAKIHVHTKSEHDIEGVDQPGEIHFVHEIESPKDGSQLIVLAVFIGKLTPKTPKSASSTAHTDFVKQWTAGLNAARNNKKGGVPDKIDPKVIVTNTKLWFRYEGSLTSEPYSEIVKWVVLTEPLQVESETLKSLEQLAHQPERLPLPINRRFLLRSFR